MMAFYNEETFSSNSDALAPSELLRNCLESGLQNGSSFITDALRDERCTALYDVTIHIRSPVSA